MPLNVYVEGFYVHKWYLINKEVQYVAVLVIGIGNSGVICHEFVFLLLLSC